MDSIAIDCPSCSEKLEVDAGFAGGVCRCSKCGTLMTVPRDPARERAESLHRPQRPDTPGGRSPANAPTPPPEAEVTLTTDSGKSIRVSSANVATARSRRKVLNAGVIAGFAVLVVGALAIAILAIGALSGGSSQDVNPDQSLRDAAGGYDPAVNPFLSKTPNVLGIGLGKQPALVIDGSSTGRSWLPLVLDAVAAQFKTDTTGRDAQVIIWTEADARVLPEKPGPLHGAQHAKLVEFLNGVVPVGVAEPAPALAAALQGQPSQVVLVTGQSLSSSQVDQLAKLMSEKGSGVRLDVLVIGGQLGGLRDLAAKHNGLAVELPVQRIAAWQQEADAAAAP